MNPELQYHECWDKLEKDGFLILRNFLDPNEVEKARQDIEKWQAIDLEARSKNKIPQGDYFKGPTGHTNLTSGKHILIDFFAKSPTLDQLFEQMLTHPVLARVTERLGGKHLKLRGYNIRTMTGEFINSAMEWHRDNPGEITWGIILSETEPLVDGGTSFVPGSHKFPFCPFQKAVFPMPYADAKPPTKLSYFSQRLAEKTLSNAIDAVGKPGDCLIFTGELWHARRPNLHGKHGMVLFAGAFPTEFKFPTHTEVVIPSKEILDRLPPAFRKIVDYRNTPPNPDKSAYVYELKKQQQKRGFLTLWHLAALEKMIFDLQPKNLYRRFKQLVKPYAKPLIARFKRAV